MGMNINLNAISTMRGEYAAVEAEIESWQTYGYRTGKNVQPTISALKQRLIDIELIIARRQDSTGGYAPATPTTYGLVKYDNITIKINPSGQLYYANQDSIDQMFSDILAKNTEQDEKILDLEVYKADLVNGYVPVAQLPPGVLDQFFSVATTTQLTTLTTANVGDHALITSGVEQGNQYILAYMPPTVQSNWLSLNTSDIGDYVVSVNGLTGIVSLDLQNLPGVQNALNDKANSIDLSKYLPLTGGRVNNNLGFGQIDFGSSTENMIYGNSDGHMIIRSGSNTNPTFSFYAQGNREIIRVNDIDVYYKNIPIINSINSKMSISGGTFTGGIGFVDTLYIGMGGVNAYYFSNPDGVTGVRLRTSNSYQILKNDNSNILTITPNAAYPFGINLLDKIQNIESRLSAGGL